MSKKIKKNPNLTKVSKYKNVCFLCESTENIYFYYDMDLLPTGILACEKCANEEDFVEEADSYMAIENILQECSEK